MNILVLGSLPPVQGGLEVFLEHYCSALVERGHTVRAISGIEGAQTSSRKTIETEDAGYTVLRVDLRGAVSSQDPTRIVKSLSQIKRFASDAPIDVVHIHPGGGEIFFWDVLMRRLKGCPSVVTLHGLELVSGDTGSVQSILDHAHSITAVSHAVANRFAQNHNGMSVTATILNALPPAGPARPYPTALTVLGMGRMVKEKGFVDLVHSLHTVFEQVPDCKVVIAGEGPERAPLQAYVGAYFGSKADQVHFPGWCTPAQMQELIHESSVVAVPSVWDEPFGLVAIEAGRVERPTVVTNSGELPVIVEHGKTGLVVPKNDPNALGNALVHILQNRDQAQIWGQNARRLVEERYDFDSMISSYIDTLRMAAFS